MSASLQRGKASDLSPITIVMTTAVKTTSVIDVSGLPSASFLVITKKFSRFGTVCIPVENYSKVVHEKHVILLPDIFAYPLPTYTILFV